MEGDGKVMRYVYSARYDPVTMKRSYDEIQILIPARSKEEADAKIFRLVVGTGTTALWKYMFSYEI